MAKRANPLELVVFGNPKRRRKARARRNAGTANHRANCKCFACKHARGEKWIAPKRNARKNRKSLPKDGPNDPKGYAKRVRELEEEGLATSDAQAVADAEFSKARASGGRNPSKRNPKRRNAGSVFSKAVSLGFPYLRGEGKTAADGKTWLSRVTKSSDGTGPAAYVGWSQEKKKWIIERENVKRNRKNPASETDQAVRLFKTFQGKDPKGIVEEQRSAAMRLDYTALGDLMHLKIRFDDGEKDVITFEGDGVRLASSANGKQLYLIGGNQNLNGVLTKLADDASKDLFDLGEVTEVQYLARKAQGNYEPVEYYHKFGEEDGTRPRLAYDKLKKEIYFIGGAYRVEAPGIIN